MRMKGMFFMLFFLGISFSMFGQITAKKTTEVLSDSTLKLNLQSPFPIDSIISFGKNLLGKPYRYKTSSGDILDCSGFLSYIFNEKNYKIPRNSGAIFNFSKQIEIEEVRKGDMLFFKGRNINNPQIGHVCLVVDVNERGPVIMHSSRRGVIIEEYTLAYYKTRFLKAGRLPFFNPDVIVESIISKETVIDSNSTAPSPLPASHNL